MILDGWQNRMPFQPQVPWKPSLTRAHARHQIPNDRHCEMPRQFVYFERHEPAGCNNGEVFRPALLKQKANTLGRESPYSFSRRKGESTVKPLIFMVGRSRARTADLLLVRQTTSANPLITQEIFRCKIFSNTH